MLVIVGGVTSNTDATQLAEIFAENKCSTKVIGVPVTFYGDLKNQFVEADVGFDTICKVTLLGQVPAFSSKELQVQTALGPREPVVQFKKLYF
ncbi:pyrophosphate--fructose 6-phosphate 1-phosphotransferase subunit alpha 2-like isoform X2 [Asparagus officinalis]|uniref:pyrophosphate--fructose 6-phosphate 1-phosphotransferase subunit alpha 2-like isoform X2 n=1 Tax=Asparagus officinalis TaxID=4686 RepID=UPI00098E68DA|nr:pyrophosphate--fructose 6-phosphate 1-phosphotransferase subunit alpha 2-like isoform X2 [Asparagus officinalis]